MKGCTKIGLAIACRLIVQSRFCRLIRDVPTTRKIRGVKDAQHLFL